MVNVVKHYVEQVHALELDRILLMVELQEMVDNDDVAAADDMDLVLVSDDYIDLESVIDVCESLALENDDCMDLALVSDGSVSH